MINKIALDIIKHFGTSTFIETGTDAGETALYIKENCPSVRVVTVDINQPVQFPEIEVVQSDSVDFLREYYFHGNKAMFYLDAHSYNVSPLHNELRQIRQYEKAIILVDDFLVPFHWAHKFDLYQNEANCWYRIKHLFTGRKVRMMYPCQANRDSRGTGILFVGYDTLPALDWFEHRCNDYLWMWTIEATWKVWQRMKRISIPRMPETTPLEKILTGIIGMLVLILALACTGKFNLL